MASVGRAYTLLLGLPMANRWQPAGRGGLLLLSALGLPLLFCAARFDLWYGPIPGDPQAVPACQGLRLLQAPPISRTGSVPAVAVVIKQHADAVVVGSMLSPGPISDGPAPQPGQAIGGVHTDDRHEGVPEASVGRWTPRHHQEIGRDAEHHDRGYVRAERPRA